MKYWHRLGKKEGEKYKGSGRKKISGNRRLSFNTMQVSLEVLCFLASHNWYSLGTEGLLGISLS